MARLAVLIHPRVAALGLDRWPPLGTPLNRIWGSAWEDFLAVHPLWAWVVNRPLLALAIALVGLLLFSGLLRAIARLTERFWLALGQLPLRLVVWLFSALTRWLRRPQAAPTDAPRDRARQIGQRLEALHQEEAALLRELQTLLADRPPPG